MEIRDIGGDIVLQGREWNDLLSCLDGKIFKTYYQVFILCASIGIMKDKRRVLQLTEEEKELPKLTIPRTVLMRNISDLDFLFSTAIITTESINKSVDERLRLAFGNEETEFKKMNFLEEFAHYGLIEMSKVISKNDLEVMQNIKDLFEELEEHDLLSEIEIDLETIY